MKVGDMICVADFHDLCQRLSQWESFSESRKVGIIKFGLKMPFTAKIVLETFDKNGNTDI